MKEAFSWQSATPASQGFDAARLDALCADLAARSTKAFLVVRGDRIVYEWYVPGHGPAIPHYTASLAKALVGGLSLLVALDDGRLTLNDPAYLHIPAWRNHPLKGLITIRQLATHSSGLDDSETPGKGHLDQGGWKEAFWRREPDPFTIARDRAPVTRWPGTRLAYSNPGMAMLAYAVTAALRNAPQADIRSLLKERIMDPLGVPEEEWPIGYGRAYEVDGMALYANWGGASYTARAVARIGRLLLRAGEWDGRRLIGEGWAREMVAYAGTPLPHPWCRTRGDPEPGSGLGGWSNFDGVWPALPRDAFVGEGAGNQVLLVVPSLNLIVVRNGDVLDPRAAGEGAWAGPLDRHIFTPLMEAISRYRPRDATRPPYPPSPVIRGVTFAPASSIVRDAMHSDNWPLTWADDGEQYTSYGDGWGFEPFTERKLSIGVARVEGPAEAHLGSNIRSASAEYEGDGPSGPKASGLLMVDGVLYMWVRNLANSQLAWSSDRGKTWEWGFRFDTSFGCPAFLNAGRNYEGARDGYVYTYASDGPSTYESYDGLVLARVPRGRVRERADYEFFAGLDGENRPTWSADIAQRRSVFSFPGNCQRLDVVWNPGICRCLLALGFDHDGGWGIFDAPEPWGPWTTAFYTRYWGLGNTHGYRLPAKWISADGKTLYLVFSGRTHDGTMYDAFCLRRLDLDLF